MNHFGRSKRNNFSKISSPQNVLYKTTTELTFENLHQRRIQLSCGSTLTLDQTKSQICRGWRVTHDSWSYDSCVCVSVSCGQSEACFKSRESWVMSREVWVMTRESWRHDSCVSVWLRVESWFMSHVSWSKRYEEGGMSHEAWVMAHGCTIIARKVYSLQGGEDP